MFNPFSAFLSSPRFRFAWLLVLIGLVNALFWTAYRWNFENHYRTVQFVCDYDDTRSMADGFGKTQEQLLRDMKARGINSILLAEQNLTSLSDNGRLVVQSREAAERLYPALNWAQFAPEYRFMVTSDDAALLAQIYPRLQEQAVLAPQLVQLAGGGQGILISSSRQLRGEAQLGFDPQQLALARKVGLIVAARLANPASLTPSRLSRLLDDVKNQAGARVLFMGDEQVLGFQSLISPVARELRRRGLLFALVEFNKTRGAGDMAMSSEGKMVRVHTVLPEEALGAEPELMVDRYVRAAKERNMRVLFIRLMRHQKGEPAPVEGATAPLRLDKSAYDQNMELIERVSSEVQRPPLPGGLLRPGLSTGEARGFGDYPLAQMEPTLGHKGAWLARYLMRFLSGVGVVGLTLLLLNLFFDLRPVVARNWALVGLALVAILSLSNGMGAKIIALEGGTACSIVAFLWGGLPLVWDGLKRPNSARSPIAVALFGLGVLWRTTLLTLIGGIYTTALLNHWYYLSKADKFLFPKGTQFFPLLLIPFAFAGELFPHRVEAEGAAPGRARAMARIRSLVSRPFTAQTAIWAVVIAVVGFVWMARFGNDSGMEISSFELKSRALLEQIFITRPRTKEIFVGHPAFFLCIAFLLRRRKTWAFVALIPAIIGQTDVLNTMCHLHTPVFFNLWRSLTGVLLGAFIGFLALVPTLALLPRPKTGAPTNGQNNGTGEVHLDAPVTAPSVL